MTNTNDSQSSLYVKGTNYGAYLAYFLLGYEYNFEVYRYGTPYILAGLSYQITIPYGATNIWFYAMMWPGRFINYFGIDTIQQPLCYAFYGTVFNPSCKSLPSCEDVSNQNFSHPCCCHCCCPSGNTSCGTSLQ